MELLVSEEGRTPVSCLWLFKLRIFPSSFFFPSNQRFFFCLCTCSWEDAVTSPFALSANFPPLICNAILCEASNRGPFLHLSPVCLFLLLSGKADKLALSLPSSSFSLCLCSLCLSFASLPRSPVMGTRGSKIPPAKHCTPLLLSPLRITGWSEGARLFRSASRKISPPAPPPLPLLLAPVGRFPAQLGSTDDAMLLSKEFEIWGPELLVSARKGAKKTLKGSLEGRGCFSEILCVYGSVEGRGLGVLCEYCSVKL